MSISDAFKLGIGIVAAETLLAVAAWFATAAFFWWLNRSRTKLLKGGDEPSRWVVKEINTLAGVYVPNAKGGYRVEWSSLSTAQ
jgi:hypothetical protein